MGCSLGLRARRACQMTKMLSGGAQSRVAGTARLPDDKRRALQLVQLVLALPQLPKAHLELVLPHRRQPLAGQTLARALCTKPLHALHCQGTLQGVLSTL